MSTLPEPPADLPGPADPPGPADVAAERNIVRRWEAQLAVRHGADTPAYWHAMAERLHAYLAGPRFRTAPDAPHCESTERARGWLMRVAAAYQALALTSARR